jgi:hypothetical protein
MSLMKKATHEITIQIQKQQTERETYYSLSGEHYTETGTITHEIHRNPGYLNTVPNQRQRESPDFD